MLFNTYKVPVKEDEKSSRALLHNTVPIINNTVWYPTEIKREMLMLNALPRTPAKKKKKKK